MFSIVITTNTDISERKKIHRYRGSMTAKTFQRNLYHNFISKSLGMIGYYEKTFNEQLKKDRRFLKKIIKKYSSNANDYKKEYKHIIIFKKFYY